jgi:hypothetical protein
LIGRKLKIVCGRNYVNRHTPTFGKTRSVVHLTVRIVEIGSTLELLRRFRTGHGITGSAIESKQDSRKWLVVLGKGMTKECQTKPFLAEIRALVQKGIQL